MTTDVIDRALHASWYDLPAERVVDYLAWAHGSYLQIGRAHV